VLYYNPAAQAVVATVAVPGLSPNVEKVRLTADDEGAIGAQRERDVVQYYQYSADMGNTVGPHPLLGPNKGW
jgi:SEL1 protein